MSADISVNGQAKPYAGRTVSDVLAACGIDPARPGIAVAVNASVAPRAAWAAMRLEAGDCVEIVQAKAGG